MRKFLIVRSSLFNHCTIKKLLSRKNILGTILLVEILSIILLFVSCSITYGNSLNNLPGAISENYFGVRACLRVWGYSNSN